MQQRGVERYAPLAGVLFLALIIATFVTGGDPPDVKASTAEVVEFWSDDETKQIVSSILGALAAVALVWFGGSLRNAIARAEGGTGRLASIAFGGVVIIAVGGLFASALQFAAAETAGDVPGEVTQTIAVLNEELFFPFIGGIALMLLATGIAGLRYGVLPRWLAIVTVVLGVIAITPIGFFVFLAALLWVAVVGVLLFQAENRAAEPA